MSEDTKYAYAVGKIRALEPHLLDKSRLETLVSAGDAGEVLRGLSDTDYGSFLSDLADEESFDQGLNAWLGVILNIVSGLLYDEELTDIFRMRYDFHNLKILLKTKYFSALRPDIEGLPLTDIGRMDPVKMREAVEESIFTDLPDSLRPAAEEAVRAGDEKEIKNARGIDNILDKQMYSIMENKTRHNRHVFLRKYFCAVIDLLNIKTFLRFKDLSIAGSFFEESVLEGGEWLEPNQLIKYYEESVNSFLTFIISSTPYAEVVDEGMNYRREQGFWAGLEKLSDNYLLSFLRSAKYVVFGPEPVIAYFFACENEMKTVRMIMVGKLNNLPEDFIRERLRDVY